MKNLRELILSKLERGPLGRRIVSEAQLADQLAEQRKRDVAELQALRAERDEKLPALVAREKKMLEDAVASILASHQEVAKVQRERMDLDFRTSGRISELEERLRRTTDPRLAGASGGGVGEAVTAMLMHLRNHGSVHLDAWRIRARDAQENGTPDTRLEQAINLADAARDMEKQLGPILRDLEAVRLAESADASDALQALAAKLPTRCVCGTLFAFDLAPAAEPEEEVA